MILRLTWVNWNMHQVPPNRCLSSDHVRVFSASEVNTRCLHNSRRTTNTGCTLCVRVCRTITHTVYREYRSRQKSISFYSLAFVSSKQTRYKCLSNGQHFDLTQKLLYSTLLRELFCVVPLSLWYLIAKHTWHPQQQRKWSVEWVGWISLDLSTFKFLANIALS